MATLESKVKSVAADIVAVGGLVTFGFGLYRTFGVGVCCIVLGVLVTGVGVMVSRNNR